MFVNDLDFVEVFSKSPMESTLVHIVFLLKNGGNFKRTLRTLRCFYLVGPIIDTKNLYNGRYNKY